MCRRLQKYIVVYTLQCRKRNKNIFDLTTSGTDKDNSIYVIGKISQSISSLGRFISVHQYNFKWAKNMIDIFKDDQ